jgi:pimeloyl-ACP methyl ester carboxylesterase
LPLISWALGTHPGDGALSYRASFGLVPLAEKLADQFMIFTYDRRGRGESSAPSQYTLEHEIEDLEALINEADGSASLFGISSGASLALEAALALDGKVKKLALYEAPYNSMKL